MESSTCCTICSYRRETLTARYTGLAPDESTVPSVIRSSHTSLILRTHGRWSDHYTKHRSIIKPSSYFECRCRPGTTLTAQGSPVLLQPHSLYVYEFPDSIGCEFSTVPRMLHTAERHSRVGDDHLVQENHSCLEFVDEAFGFRRIMCPGAGSQSETAVIRNLD